MGGGAAASRINGRPAVRQPRIHKQAVNNLRVRQTEASIKSDLSDALQPAEAASPRQRDAQSSVNTPLVGRRRGGGQLEGRCQSVGEQTDRQTDVRRGRGLLVATVGGCRKRLRPLVPRESASRWCHLPCRSAHEHRQLSSYPQSSWAEGWLVITALVPPLTPAPHHPVNLWVG